MKKHVFYIGILILMMNAGVYMDLNFSDFQLENSDNGDEVKKKDVLFSPISFATEKSLGELADSHNLSINANVALWELQDPMYLKTYKQEFNSMVVGFDNMWQYIHPERYTYDFNATDAIVQIGKDLDMPLIWRGEILWMTQYPSWLANGDGNQITDFNKTELIDILEDHIETVVGRYKDDFEAIYIANEILDSPYFYGAPYNYDDFTTEMRHNFWYDVIGPEYISIAINKTHEVAPDVKIFMNEGLCWGDNVGLSLARSNYFYDLIVNLINTGHHIDGVGLQYYTLENDSLSRVNYDWDARELEVQQFIDLGLEVHISEVGVIVEPPFTDTKMQKQAELYQKTLELALLHENVTSFTMWGMADKSALYIEDESWYIYDRNLEPQPAYYALKHRLENNTELYQHDFNNAIINPPENLVSDLAWGQNSPVNINYEVSIADYDGSGSWNIAYGDGTPVVGLNPSDKFSINIKQYPSEKVYWNFSDYFDIDMKFAENINLYECDYSFYENWYMIKNIWFPAPPEWIIQIIPDGSRLTWEDIEVKLDTLKGYYFNATDIAFINNVTSFGFEFHTDAYDLSTIWCKSTGLIEYYHYHGYYADGQMPLDFEFFLNNEIIHVISAPSNLSFEVGVSIPQILTWVLLDNTISSPLYNVSVNSVIMVENDPWPTNKIFTYDVSTLPVGIYEIEIVFDDGMGNTVVDDVSVSVNLHPITNPTDPPEETESSESGGIPGYNFPSMIVGMVVVAIGFIKKKQKMA